MDWPTHSNRPEPPPQFEDGDAGSNYLRRLKGKPEENPSNPDHETPDQDQARAAGGEAEESLSSAQAKPIAVLNVFSERRKAHRYVCSGKVEISAEGISYRVWGAITDISVHGCYVEINNTFPVGTKLTLKLEVLDIRITMAGLVRATYPFLGMGVSFGQLVPNQLADLQQLIKVLAGRKSAYGASAV